MKSMGNMYVRLLIFCAISSALIVYMCFSKISLHITENAERVYGIAEKIKIQHAKSSVCQSQSTHDTYDNHCYVSPQVRSSSHPLTAQEIVDAVTRKLGPSANTSKDLFDAFLSNMISINRSDAENIKIILGYHGFPHPMWQSLNFTNCAYSNCIGVNPHRLGHPSFTPPSPPNKLAIEAQIILFKLGFMYDGKTLDKIPRRPNQYFGLYTNESPGFPEHIVPKITDGRINFTSTYSRCSTIPSWHVYKGCQYKLEQPLNSVNYAASKSRGALAYVSHCDSVNYDRLKMIKELSKYIHVDLYGRCGKRDSCKDDKCRLELHNKYHFYLSFENSLCQDYITEKFWKNLADPANMVPVAMGGLTVQEYTDMAPNNSFIHVRNFTDIRTLGKYLNYLMSHPDKYNSYHMWRETWRMSNVQYLHVLPACELCRIANERPAMPAIEQLSVKYNGLDVCANYQEFPSKSPRMGRWKGV